MLIVPHRVIRGTVALAALLAPLSCRSAGTTAEASSPEAQPAALSVPSQNPPSDVKDLDQETPETRKSAILDEIDRLGSEHPWAGAYSSRGTDSGTEIALAPESGYAVTTSGAFHTQILACGRLLATEDALELEPQFPIAGDWSRPVTLIHVRWGERHYLLFEEMVINFCNDVNSGYLGSNPSRRYWTRAPDAPVSGKPQLPEKYASLLLDAPLEATVLSKRDRSIQLDVGLDAGVFEGMRFYKFGFFATVRSVQESTCEAVCFFPYLFDQLRSGSKLSTHDKGRD